ncbi:gamma carbonic anhydrase family protein [Corynebacterium halotolerans]|uniref:Gamma carbonic anhydrase family protein n=1 Tax=Corynebacterium halotolerans YIM 70093 = DSM 44683 TaxID=1121362 RepID=M1NUL5_9CORY|nr:gamma carbonic anhydrase family protein [Corynebacterium halotolerans]AGF71205.1 hypothetical protein A605_00945 [Corynebacterium halotolerans YIM 70093 = DSM 44683]
MNGPLILSFEGKKPKIHSSAWIAPTAVLIGDVEIGPDSSVFYGAVLRGDVNRIRVGARTNVQDNSVLHVDRDAPCVLGDDVTVGHMALVHGASVGSGALVGMKSALLSRSVVGSGSLIAAGAVVLEDFSVPAGVLVAGVPGKVRRELSGEESAAFIPHAGRYVDVSRAQAPLDQALTLDEVRF